MPRVKTSSFITELPLKVDSKQDRELEARFQAARQLYNACLSECMTRVKLIRNSVADQEAQKISRTNKKQRSEAFKKAQEIYRYSETAYGQSQNRRLVNEILRHGNQIQAENVSVKGWQKLYGKAISAKSPGFFQSELKRSCWSAGGSFTTFSTQKTALSQTHLTGERIKKSLSERVHHDRAGITMHRDFFSAFLSRYVNQDKLSLQDARFEYPRLEPVLLEAWKAFKQTAKRVSLSESTKSDSSSEQFSNDPETIDQIGGQIMLRLKSQS